jgi:hypothetical protein
MADGLSRPVGNALLFAGLAALIASGLLQVLAYRRYRDVLREQNR